MMWNSGKSAFGCVVVSLLFLLPYTLFSDLGEKTDLELYESLEMNLEQERQLLKEEQELLNADRQDYNDKLKMLIEQERVLKNDRELLEKERAWLQNVQQLSQNLRDDLKSEYWRGFMAGVVIGIPFGAWAGIKLCVTFSLP